MTADWTQATESAGKAWSAWAAAQQQALQSWTELASGLPGAAASPAGNGRGRAPAGPDFQELLLAWQRMSGQAMRTLMAAASPTSRGVAQNVEAAQAAGFRLAGMTAEALQAMSDSAAEGLSWAEAAERYVERLQAQLAQGPTAWAGLSKDGTELWRLYLAGLEQSLGPWGEMLSRASGMAEGAEDGKSVGLGDSELSELSRFYWDAWEHIASSTMAGPRMGFNRETEELLLRGFEAWSAQQRAQADYQLVIGEAWAKAFESVLQALTQKAHAGEPVSSLRELSQLWTSETDAVMERALESERYAAAQGAMVTAAMRYRIAEREIADAVLAGTHLASRSELDEAYRAIQDLRRELRELKREQAELRAAKSAPARKPKRKPSKKPSGSGS